jgi:hypothetical protein
VVDRCPGVRSNDRTEARTHGRHEDEQEGRGQGRESHVPTSTLLGDAPITWVADVATWKPSPLPDVDREFVRRVHDRCGGSLNAEVRGEEIGAELGLDYRQTAELVARLTRTGYLRDVAGHLRIKITIRSIGLVDGEE